MHKCGLLGPVRLLKLVYMEKLNTLIEYSGMATFTTKACFEKMLFK